MTVVNRDVTSSETETETHIKIYPQSCVAVLEDRSATQVPAHPCLIKLYIGNCSFGASKIWTSPSQPNG